MEREEIASGKRIVREYGPNGKLLRLRILPAPAAPNVAEPQNARRILSFGRRKPHEHQATAPAPERSAPPSPARPVALEPEPAPAAPDPQPAPEPATELPAPAAAPPPAIANPPPPPPKAIHIRFPDEPELPATLDVRVEEIPPLPTLPGLSPKPLPIVLTEAARDHPPPVAAPARAEPAAPPGHQAIHVRFPEEAELPATLEVRVEALPALPALPDLAPRPSPIVFVEPEPLTTPEEPALAAIESERVWDEPTPEPHVVLPRRFEILAVEPIVDETPATTAEPTPAVQSEPERTPEAQPGSELTAELPREPEPAIDAIPARVEPMTEPEPVAPETAPPDAPAQPEAPRSYVALVPDLDTRVDALLAREDAPAKRRKRAPIPAPAFEPLAREPWETRLDEALAKN